MEMALAGWKFFVLSPAFLIHFGLHNPGYKKEDRLIEVAHNFVRFKSFLEEKVSKYGNENKSPHSSAVDEEIKKVQKNAKQLSFLGFLKEVNT